MEAIASDYTQSIEQAERRAFKAADCARKQAERFTCQGETREARRFRLRGAWKAAALASLAESARETRAAIVREALLGYFDPIERGEALAPLNPASGSALLARAHYSIVMHPSRIGMMRGKRSRETARDPRGEHDTYTGQGRIGAYQGGAWIAAERDNPAALLLERIASAKLAASASASPLRLAAAARRSRHDCQAIAQWIEAMQAAEAASEYCSKALRRLQSDSRADRIVPFRRERSAAIDKALRAALRSIGLEARETIREGRRELLAEYTRGKLGKRSRAALRARAPLSLASLAALDDMDRGAPASLPQAPQAIRLESIRAALRRRSARLAKAEALRRRSAARYSPPASKMDAPLRRADISARRASLESALVSWREALRDPSEDIEYARYQVARLLREIERIDAPSLPAAQGGD